VLAIGLEPAPGVPVPFVVCHLKSKLLSDPSTTAGVTLRVPKTLSVRVMRRVRIRG
jgi:hypothetical protein